VLFSFCGILLHYTMPYVIQSQLLRRAEKSQVAYRQKLEAILKEWQM